MAVESITAALRARPRSEAGFLDDVASRLGPTVTDEFYRPYAAKLYGVDPVDLTAELARRRVSAASPFELVASALRARRADARTFYYPRRGYGQVSEALGAAAAAAGVELRLGEPVTEVTSGQSPSVASGSSVIEVDVVASTMPLPALVGALRSEVDQAVAAAVSALRTRAMVLVYLVVPRSRYTTFDAHYFPSLDLSISRLSEPKNYRSSHDDPADHTVLCAELTCWRGDRVWAATDDELASRVIDDLGRAGLPDPEPVGVAVRRLPAVYPVYERATEWARTEVDRWVAAIPGVLSFGRQGLGVPDNLHHVLDMGVTAASAVGSTGIDRGEWRESLTRFESNVVVD